MKPFEFQPINDEEKIFIEQCNEFADNDIKVLKKANKIDQLILIEEFSDEVLCILFTRSIEKEDYEFCALLKPVIEKREMQIPK